MRVPPVEKKYVEKESRRGKKKNLPIPGHLTYASQDIGLVGKGTSEVLHNVVIVIKTLAVVEKKESTSVF